MYPSKIKLSNITNLSDARFAAAVGIDYIGFCFDTNDVSYIPPVKAKEIFEWTSGTNIVAEFGEQSIDEIKDVSELLSVDFIEICNSILPDEFSAFQIPLIKKIDLDKFDKATLIKEIEAYKSVSHSFHLFSGSEKGGFDRDTLKVLCENNLVIWGLPLDIVNTKSIINIYKPFALNISGGNEEKPGIKDFDEMNDWLDSIRLNH
jgi:phosphoribosylanthranilate isomerase